MYLRSFSLRIQTKSQLIEQSIFPYFGVYYPMPVNTIVYNYTKIVLFAQCQVTATDDFVATNAYGHQILTTTPSASISTSGASLGISFGSGVENYSPGQIRVDVI